MGDLMDELRALRRSKEQQSAARAVAQDRQWQEVVNSNEDTRDERSAEAASGCGGHNPLKVPPSIAGTLLVSVEGEAVPTGSSSSSLGSIVGETVCVELRGPFLIWYSVHSASADDASEMCRLSIVGAAVEADAGRVVVDMGVRKVVLESTSGTGCEEWGEKLRRAARQDARRTGQAQTDTPLSSSSSPYQMSDIDRLELIGKGTYGEVWHSVIKSTGREVALKMGSITTQLGTREQSLLLDMDCPFVVRAEAIFMHDGAPCIIMPLLQGGDLDLHLDMTPEGYFTTERSRFHAAEVLCALDYLHSKGIVYRDLKPENVVLDSEGHTVLTDMGHARSLSSTAHALTFCGTAEYLAPEILDSNGHTHAVDHWALGVLLFEMMAGSLPFNGAQEDVYDRILLAEPEFPPFMSPDATELISKLLRKKADDRPRSSEIRAHAFFCGMDWEVVAARKHPPPFVPDLELIRRLTRRRLRNS